MADVVESSSASTSQSSYDSSTGSYDLPVESVSDEVDIGFVESETEVRKKNSMIYAVDDNGQPVGLPLDLFMFSESIKKPLDPDQEPDPEREFGVNNELPETKQFPHFEQVRMVGQVPLTDDFHMKSNRRRAGPLDDGLEDEDLTAADGIIRKKKVAILKRRSIIYDNIRTVKGEFTFPYRTYRPKAQVAYTASSVSTSQLPQGVVVERLHRHYKKMDINLVLQNLGIESSDLIPPPNYCETNERFYQEMVFRSRVRVNGIFKKDFIIHGDNALQKHEEHHRRLHAPKEESLSTGSYSGSYDSSQSTPDEFVDNEEEMGEQSGLEESDGYGPDGLPIVHRRKTTPRRHHRSDEKKGIHPFIRSKPPFNPMFPLHYFDNTEWDTRTPDEWINLGWDGKERRFYAIPGKAFLPLPGSYVRKTTPALSETIVDNLLNSSKRLFYLERCLLKERYERLLEILGVEMEEYYEPSTAELQLVARLGCTVEPLYEEVDEDLLTRARKLLDKKSYTRVEEEDEDNSQDEDVIVETRVEKTSQDPERHKPTTIDYEGQKLPLYNVIPKKRPDKCPGDDSDDSEFEDDESDDEDDNIKHDEAETNDEADQTGAGGKGLVDSGDQIGQTSSAELVDAETGMEESDLEDSIGEEDYYPMFPLRSYLLGEAFPTRPESSDIDPLVEGHEKYIYEFHKMKKVHVYDWKWVDVAVFDYDTTKRKYYVRSIHPPFVHAWVDKTYLCFDGEDPEKHGQRIRDAVIRRYECENQIRFNLFIDCLPMHKMPKLHPRVMANIVRKCLAASKVRYTDEALIRVQEELQLEYKRTFAKNMFVRIILKHPHLYRPWGIVPDEYRVFHKDLVLKDWMQYDEEEIPKRPFMYKVRRIQKLSVIYQKEAFEIYKKVNAICLKAKSKKLLLLDLEPMPLHDWHAKQKANIDEIRKYLKEEWYTTIIQTVRENFGRIPRSWYNIYERRYDVFAMSKLSNFLFLVKLYMESTMRSMVVESLQGFTAIVKKTVKNVDLRHRFEWDPDNLKESLYPTPEGTAPIWILELVMDKDYPKCSHMLGSFGRVVSAVFMTAMNSVKGFPQFLPQIMPSLNYATVSLLEPLDEKEPLFMSIDADIKKYIKLALLPVDSYVQLYKKYTEVWNLDVDEFIEEWSAEEHSSQEVRELVEYHIAQRKQLEEEIPDEIQITGVKLVIEYVRTGIIRRKRRLCNALLDSYASKLRTIIRGVKDAYREIERKFNIRSDDIEEVLQLRAYVENEVPGIVSGLEIICSQVIKDYEVFDHFMYRLPSEDTRITWQAALSAQRIMKESTLALKWLDQDFNRLLQIQQSFLSAVSDQVDSAGLMVAGLVRFMDLEKAVEVYPEVMKVYQMVKDLQAHSELLNHRQAVFGLPLLQNLALERLGVDIAPFKCVWYIGSEWVRLKSALSNDTLDLVDVDGLELIIEHADEIIDLSIQELEEADLDQIALVGNTIKYQMDQFRPMIPLVRTLKNPALRQRHWEAMTELCGFTVASDADNFQSLVDQGIATFAEAIVEIGDLAVQEVIIEQNLEFFDQHIGEHFVGLDKDETTKLKIITLTPETFETIHGYVEDTDSLVANPYNKPFKSQLEAWDKKIKTAQQNMDLWLELQEKRLLFEPRFKDRDIPKRIPATYKMCLKMKRIWRRLIRFVKRNPLLIELMCDFNTDASLGQLKELVDKITVAFVDYEEKLKIYKANLNKKQALAHT